MTSASHYVLIASDGRHPAAHFTDLGPDWHDRIAPIRRKRQLIAELERLTGKNVILQETAA
jgi:transposase